MESQNNKHGRNIQLNPVLQKFLEPEIGLEHVVGRATIVPSFCGTALVLARNLRHVQDKCDWNRMITGAQSCLDRQYAACRANVAYLDTLNQSGHVCCFLRTLWAAWLQERNLKLRSFPSCMYKTRCLGRCLYI